MRLLKPCGFPCPTPPAVLYRHTTAALTQAQRLNPQGGPEADQGLTRAGLGAELGAELGRTGGRTKDPNPRDQSKAAQDRRGQHIARAAMEFNTGRWTQRLQHSRSDFPQATSSKRH